MRQTSATRLPHASATWPEPAHRPGGGHEGRNRAEHADPGRPAGRGRARRAPGARRSRRAARLRLALRAGAPLHRLRHVAGADPAAELLRRPHQARHPRHRGDRAAVARPGPGRRADRAARHHVRAGAACSASAAAPPASSTPASASRWRRRGRASSRRRRSWSRRSARTSSSGTGEFFKIPRTSIRPRPISHPERRFYASLGEPRIGRDHGQARLRHAGHHAERMAEGRRGHRSASGRSRRASGHAPQPPIILTNISCAESREEAQERAVQVSRPQVAVDRRPLPFLRRPSRRRSRATRPTARWPRPTPR